MSEQANTTDAAAGAATTSPATPQTAPAGEDAPFTRGEFLKWQQEQAAMGKKSAARQTLIEGKLKEVNDKIPELLAQLPDSDDPAVLNAAADKILARARGIKLVSPDVGGATRDGGKPHDQLIRDAQQFNNSPAQQRAYLPAGLAKFAAAMKLPGTR